MLMLIRPRPRLRLLSCRIAGVGHPAYLFGGLCAANSDGDRQHGRAVGIEGHAKRRLRAYRRCVGSTRVRTNCPVPYTGSRMASGESCAIPILPRPIQTIDMTSKG